MLCSKFPMKMHEKCDFNEKERVKETYSSQKTKTLERFEAENEKKKIALDWIGREKQREECLKRYEKYEEQVRNFFLKHSQTDF